MPTTPHSSFDISDWRDNVRTRRECVRSIVIRAVSNGEQLESLIADLKRTLDKRQMDDAERNLFYVTVHDIRTIVGGWKHLGETERQRFVAGKGAPSTIAAQIRKHRER